MNESASLQFEVLSGHYFGLAGKADGGTRLIGSGLDADIVFVEQGLEPHHLRISLVGNSVEIEALAAGVSIEGGESIAAGERVIVSLPAVLQAGAISIRWSIEDSSRAGAIPLSRLSIAALACSLLVFIAIGTLSAILLHGADAGASPPSPGLELASKLTRKGPDDSSTRAAAKTLQREIDRAGLLDIKLASGLGVVTAQGTVSSDLVGRWQAVQQWFDHYTNGEQTLVSEVAVKQENRPSSIAVQAVWRGAEPYLLVGGQKYFAGALLNDGWTVDRIEEGRVLLSRNGRSAVLSY